MKLISMVNYILEYTNKLSLNSTFRVDTTKYAEFINQPLKLGMFIPCSKDGSALKKPIESNYNLGDIHAGYYSKDLEQYQEVEKNVVFEIKSFEKKDNEISYIIFQTVNIIYYAEHKSFWSGSKELKTIEDLIKYNVKIKNYDN